MSMKQRVRLFAALTILITACGNLTNQVPTCPDFALFQGQISETFTPQEFLSWITETQGVSASDVKVLDGPPTSIIAYVWTIGNYRYSAELEDDKFTEIRIGRMGRGGIPAHIVIECLGEPEIYRAFHHSNTQSLGGELRFEMVFPDLGIVASGSTQYMRVPTAPLSVDENFVIEYFLITSPGTAIELLQQWYGNQAQKTFDWIHLWPENWGDIQVDVTPEMQRRLLGTH